MTRARLWLALTSALLVVLPAVGTVPDAAGLLVITAALVAAAVARYVPVAPRVVADRCDDTHDVPPTPASRMPDPVHHPLRPRAPGLV